MVSVKDIMNAISIKLYETFGEGYEIYQNDIEQGLIEPCFLITLVDYSKEQLLLNRSKRVVPFDILFFPKNGKSQCYEVAEKMMNELELIKLVNDDLLRGTSMKFEVIDNTLHFFVNYNFIAVLSTEETDSMENISVGNIETKE